MKPNFTYFDDFRGYTGSQLPKEFTVLTGACQYIKGDPDGVLRLLTSYGAYGVGTLQSNENFVFRQPVKPEVLTLETKLKVEAMGTMVTIDFGVISTVDPKVKAKFWCDNQDWRAIVNSGKSKISQNVILSPFEFFKQEWVTLRMRLSTEAIEFYVNDNLRARFISRRRPPHSPEDVVYSVPDKSHIWRPYIGLGNDSVSIMALDLDYLLISCS